MNLAVPLDLAPMEARLVDEIPHTGNWQYEPKWDGFRCLAFRAGDEVRLRSKSGRDLERYFPEVVERLGRLSCSHFVLDGELVIERDGRLWFDELLQRIHPAASRVAKLARERAASYLVFDVLATGERESLVGVALAERRVRLERFFECCVPRDVDVRLSPTTTELAGVDAWYARAGGALDGVVAKDRDAPYRAGERDAVLKIKPVRSADCVVGGYRVAADGTTLGSLLLGLYDADGALHYVGFTSGYDAATKREVLARLAPLATSASFTGRAPGGPGRWSRGASTEWRPVRPELVLEVAFDQVTAGRFRHGTRPLRWRPDKATRSCTMHQIDLADAPCLRSTARRISRSD